MNLTSFVFHIILCVLFCRQYLWVDEKGKKCKCAAPQYVEYVMTFTQKTIHDETVFPTKYGKSLL